MYSGMSCLTEASPSIERGLALHKVCLNCILVMINSQVLLVSQLDVAGTGVLICISILRPMKVKNKIEFSLNICCTIMFWSHQNVNRSQFHSIKHSDCFRGC